MRPRDPEQIREQEPGPSVRDRISPESYETAPLSWPQTPLQLPAIYSPTHYAPSGVVPEPHLGDPKGQEGQGAVVAVAQAGPPAADFGTAPPCRDRLYGGPARGAIFN
jgi:hypothetical protein